MPAQPPPATPLPSHDSAGPAPPHRPPHPTAAHTWAEPALPPPQDPAEQFKFAPGPAAGARAPAAGPSAGMGALSSRGAAGGARAPFKATEKAPQGDTHDAEAAVAHPSLRRSPPDEVGDDDDDDDSADTVVLAQPTGGSRNDSGSPSPRLVPDPMAQFRLPVGPPRKPEHASVAVKSSISETIVAPDPGSSGAPRRAGGSGVALHNGTGTKLFQPQGVASTHYHDPPSHLASSSAGHSYKAAEAHAHATAPGPAPAAPSKKRTHSSEAGAPASSRGSKAPTAMVQPAQGTGHASTTSSAKQAPGTGRTHSGPAKTGDGADEARGSKRRRTADAKSAVQVIMNLDQGLKKKDAELAHLRDRIARRDAELEKLFEGKHKLKNELAARVKAAVERASLAQKELAELKSGTAEALDIVKSSVGSVASAGELKHELDQIKTALSEHCFDEENKLWLERFEETKLEVLKDLQVELVKGNDVINFLRKDLDTKAGLLAETSASLSHVQASLEDAQAKVITLQHDRLVLLESSQTEKVRHRDELDAVQAAAREKEEALRAARDEAQETAAARVREAMVREEKLGHEWVKAKEEAAEREVELKREALRVASLEARKAEDAVAIEQLRSDIAAARDDLETETQRASECLKDAREDLERERAEHAKRVSEAMAEAEAERDNAHAALAEANALHEKTRSRLEEDLDGARGAVKDLNARVSQAERSLAEARKAQQALTDEKDELQRKLDIASSEAAKAAAAAEEETSKLRQQVERLVLDMESLSAAKLAAEDSRRHLFESHSRLKSDSEATLEQVARLQRDLAAAREEKAKALEAKDAAVREAEDRAEAKLAAREKELTELAVKERQAAATAALEQGKALRETELLDKGNELKRANNKLEELNKKHNRALSELAKAKARPIIDPHIASSSTNGDPSPQGGARPTGPANGPRDPTSPLVAGASHDTAHAGAGSATKGRKKPKGVAFTASAAPAAPSAPAKPQRRASAAGTKPHTSILPPVATSTKRVRAPPVFDDADDADETLVQQDDDETMEAGEVADAEESFEATLEQRDGQDEGDRLEEEEDDIIDANTPVLPPVAKPKPRTKYTSSSKKRR